MSLWNLIVSTICGLLAGGVTARVMVAKLVTDNRVSNKSRSSVKQRASRQSQNIGGDQTNYGDPRGR